MSHRASDSTTPRAPSQDEWDAMSTDEREAAVAELPASVPLELHPPEGDQHSAAKDGVVSALREFFRRTRRKVYVTKELATYYPGEAMFCPDVLAVREVELHPRATWVVSAERRGLDFVLEVHVSGDRRKDFETNVRRYARLGIPEYFAFDRGRMRLEGWRLADESARVYVPITPQAGRFTSSILNLDLALEEERVRFYCGTAPLAEAEELVQRLEHMVDEITGRAVAQTAELEAKLATALAELDELRAR